MKSKVFFTLFALAICAAFVLSFGHAGSAQAGSTSSQAGSTGSQAGSTGSQAGSTGSQAGSTGSQAGSTGSQAGSTGSQAGSTGSQAGSTAPRAHIAIADTNIDWDKMSHAEKKDYMKNVVMPKIAPLMHNFDPKMFPDVKCVTCHGNGARDGSFKMPNSKLTVLPATRTGFDTLLKEKPAAMKFMTTVMKPTMADLLGMKVLDMKTGLGFGCNNCHTSEKK